MPALLARTKDIAPTSTFVLCSYGFLVCAYPYNLWMNLKLRCENLRSASILRELAAHLSGVLIRIEASQQMDDVIREFDNRLNARRP